MTARERRLRTSTIWSGSTRSAAVVAITMLGGTFGFGPCTTRTETTGAAPTVEAPAPTPATAEPPSSSVSASVAPLMATSGLLASSATSPMLPSAPVDAEPTCADLHMKLGRFPGLLPDGIPTRAAEYLVYPDRRGSVKPPIPVKVGGDAFFVYEGIDRDELKIFRLEDDHFALAHTIPVPPVPSHDRLSSYQLDVAAGPSSLGLAVVSGKELFLILIDTRKWTVKKIVPLPFVDETPYPNLTHPHIAWGDGRYGVAARTDRLIGFQAVTEAGKPSAPPSYFKSSSYIEPRVAYNGSKFGILAGRSGDSNSYSIGLWEISPDGKNAQYLPVVDSPEPGIKDFFDRRYYYIGGALTWKTGAYALGAMSQTDNHRKPGHVAQIIHYRDGSGTRIENCGETTF